MLHSIKRKTFGRVTSKHQPVNAEFDTLSNNLENVQKALTAALDDIDTSDKAWKAVVSNTNEFSSRLHTLYPQDDDVRALFKASLDVQDKIAPEIESVKDAKSKVKSIERMVRAYLIEIKTLTEEYSKVEKARRDYSLYQSKANKLSKKAQGDSDRQSKNLDKLEASKATYNSILLGAVHRMTSTFEKSPTMFRATFVAYWLYQSRFSGVISTNFARSFEYANTHADDVFNIAQTQNSSAGPS